MERNVTAMKKLEIRIRTLTPIWTGGPDGTPNGLKMSGVIGGMRQAFEMLVRKHGGHTCNITGPANHRCNYERDKRVCPACAVFGCTGLSRAFKINLDLPTVTPVIPQSDLKLPNRDHDNTQYNAPCSIDTWLASVLVPDDSGMLRPGEHKTAQDKLKAALRLSYSPAPINMRILPLRRNLPDDLDSILTYLLAFMSRYSGLGAKIRQGWGQFEMPDITEEEIRAGEGALVHLVQSSGFTHHDWDAGLPTASDLFCAEWNLGDAIPGDISWPGKGHPEGDCLSTGFLLNYRLRRCIKFLEVDTTERVPVAGDWRTMGYKNVPWKETIPFVRAVFGRDNAKDHDKHSGLVGMSHLFKKDGNWHMTFFGRIPAVYLYRERNGNSTRLTWSPGDVREFLIGQASGMLGKASTDAQISMGGQV